MVGREGQVDELEVQKWGGEEAEEEEQKGEEDVEEEGEEVQKSICQ